MSIGLNHLRLLDFRVNIACHANKLRIGTSLYRLESRRGKPLALCKVGHVCQQLSLPIVCKLTQAVVVGGIFCLVVFYLRLKLRLPFDEVGLCGIASQSLLALVDVG